MRCGPRCSARSRTMTTPPATPTGTASPACGTLAHGPTRTRHRAVKKQLQNEMGLLPLQLLRDRRESFVELYSYDNFGASNYGTAGYLGQRLLHHGETRRPRARRRRRRTARDRPLVSIKVRLQGRDPGDARRRRRRRRRSRPRRLGDHPGRASVDMPALRVDTIFDTSSRNRSSGWETTTRRASSCQPATSASGRPTAS